MKGVLEIHVDGACRGNPGPAAIGFVIEKDGKVIKEIAQSIGQATNNIAEYSALIYALQEALLLKAENLKIFTDSELMYKQIIGDYQVKQEHLKPLFDQVKHLWHGFKEIKITHVLREHNKKADALASGVLKDLKKASQDGCPDG